MKRDIKYIALHCTAGAQSATIVEVERVFAVRGWSRPGYHYVITADGKIHQLLDEDKISNGVRGYNKVTINIAYTGGVDISKAEISPIDNRTEAQKKAIVILLKELRKRYPNAKIQGHRDFSPDVNGNGVVDKWERIKECPCFDAIEEYKHI